MAANSRIQHGGEGPSGSRHHAVEVADLLPAHIRAELKSSNMTMLTNATLRDPQEISADKKITVVLDKIDPEPITVLAFRNTSYSQRSHTILMCSTINEIFVGESTGDSDSVRLFLQALVMIFGKSVLTSIRAEHLLADAGLSLQIDEIDSSNETTMNDLETDVETVACMSRLGVASLANPQVTLMAYCGSILLLAGKQLNEASVNAWTARRVRGLAASMGTSIEIASIAPFNVQAAVRVYQKLSMLVQLRASMVRVLFGSTGAGTQVSSLAGAMLNLLAWSEMNHIRMVQEYIFGRFPELLSMKQLQGSTMGILKTAWDFLDSLDEHERPFAKLLYGPQKTRALQRDRFVLLTDAAHAVGSYLHASFANYQGDTQGTAGQAIKKTVTEYLHNLEKTGSLIVQAAQYTMTDRRVLANVPNADRLFNNQLEDLDQEIRAAVRE